MQLRPQGFGVRQPHAAFVVKLWRLTFGCCLFFAIGLLNSLGQQTSAPPTRAEILKGALTPERTCYDVTSYNLDVRIDLATKSLKGSNKITFRTVNDFTRMQVDLWSNLPISKITFDDGSDAKFARELNAVFVELPEQARKDSSHSITVFYSGVPTVAKRATQLLFFIRVYPPLQSEPHGMAVSLGIMMTKGIRGSL